MILDFGLFSFCYLISIAGPLSACLFQFQVTATGLEGKIRYRCSCDRYKAYDGLCGHIVAIAVNEEDLRDTLSNYCSCGGRVEQLIENSLPSGGGEKPGNKKPRRGKNNLKSAPITRVVQWNDPILDIPKPFQGTKPWHNENPFLVHLLSDPWCKKATKCESCGVTFPANNSPEANIILIHLEKSSKGKEERKFYCCRKKCLHDRHPYFWKGLVKVTDKTKERLSKVHADILYENLNLII